MTDWPEMTFGELCENSTFGPRLSIDKDAPDGNVAALRPTDMRADGRIEYGTMRLAKMDLVPVRQHILQHGDLVITRTGRVGTTAVFEEFALPVLPEASLIRFRLNREIADPRFYQYFFNSPEGQNRLLATVTGSVQQNLNITALHRLTIPVPPLAVQEQLAGILGFLDDKIDQNRQTARTLERLTSAIYRGWFVDFEPVKAKAAGATFFPSMSPRAFDALPSRFVDSDIGAIPEGWQVKRIGDVVTVMGGGTPSTKEPDYWGGEHCWATPKDMSRLSHSVLLDTERRITDAGLNAIGSGIVPPGTVLMSSRAPVGYLAMARVRTAINQGIIAMICDGPLPPAYVLHWAFHSMDAIKAHATGTTFPEISKRNFRPLPVLQPTGDVIAAYQQLVDPLFDLLTALVTESEQLAKVRQYLLPRLLSGRIKVRA